MTSASALDRSQWRSRLAQYGPVAAAVVVVLLIALYRDFVPNLTLDEAFSLDTARRPFLDAWSRALNFELQPPLYFMALKLWLLVSPTLEWARLLSTACAVAAVLVMARIARTLGSGAELLPLIVALSPTVLWMGSYARCYVLAFLLGSVSTLFAIRLLVTGSSAPRRDAVLYGTSGLLLLWTFYYGGFLLAGHAAAALFADRERRNRFAVTVVAMVVLFAPWLPVVAMQATDHPVYTSAVALTGTGLGRGWSAIVVTWPYLRDVVLAHSAFIERPAVLAGMLVWGVVIIGLRLRAGPARWSRSDSQLLWMALVPAVAMVALRDTNALLVVYRYMFVATVGTLIFVTALSGRLQPSSVRTGGQGVLVLFMVVSAFSYTRNFDAQDMFGAANYVRHHAGSSEPVLFFSGQLSLPFREVFKGSNTLVGLGQSFAAESTAVRKLEAVPAGGTFWLVFGDWERHTAWFGGVFLERAISDRAAVLEQRTFTGLTLLHLRLGNDRK